MVETDDGAVKDFIFSLKLIMSTNVLFVNYILFFNAGKGLNFFYFIHHVEAYCLQI